MNLGHRRENSCFPAPESAISEVMDDAVTVFVYGTLKRGCRNHSVLKMAMFLGEAWTQPIYRMYNCGSYPGLVHSGPAQGRAIQGELYRVGAQLLVALDVFEDAPREYIRAPVYLLDRAIAQAYFYRGDTAHLPLCGAVWIEK